MTPSLQRPPETADVETLPASAEDLVERAAEGVADPITVNQLKQGQFTRWKIRAERRG